MKTVLIVEPFFGGSHKQLIDFLLPCLQSKYHVKVATLPDKKWHWRARTSALYFAQTISSDFEADILFCSSVLNLAELVALRPDLSRATKIIYFHENQLVYPVQVKKERDFQYGYNQILSALVADKVVFNSKFNQNSFLVNIGSHFKLQPDFRPKHVETQIQPKSVVIHFPVAPPPSLSLTEKADGEEETEKVLHIVWPHRWEHDKNPEAFFNVLFQLQEADCRFKVSVLGQAFSDIPDCFDAAQKRLGPSRIAHWGYQDDKQSYWQALADAHVAVSTANHEFFGVSMVEAAMSGCMPLAPNRLAYPEVFPKECLFSTDQQLFKKLRSYCRYPDAAKKDWANLGGSFNSNFDLGNSLRHFESLFSSSSSLTDV